MTTRQRTPERTDPEGTAPEGQRQRFAEVYAVLESAIAEGAFPGCAFGALQGERVVLLDGLGQQDYVEGSPAVTASSAYDLASLTKVVATTAMAMLLYQRGLLALDRPVEEVLPGFLNGSGPRRQVTVRHLLAHNSGLAGYARLYADYATPGALFNACLAMPLEAKPGERSEYSDIGFILLGRVLEVLAGEPLDAFCAREIFNPLGMRETRFRPPTSLWHAIPPTEDDRVFRHRAIQGEVQDENCWVLGGISGHAGLFGTVPDLLRFARAMVAPENQSPFAPETIQLFSARVAEPVGSSRALGWDTPSIPSSSGSRFSARSIGHLGFSGTSLWIDLADRVGVVLLSNRCWPTRENQKIKQVRPAFHDAVRNSLASSQGWRG